MSVVTQDILDIVKNQQRWRRQECINLIASENVQSSAVQQIEDNDFMCRYAEGHPNTPEAGQIAMGDGQFLTAIDGTKASGVTVAYEREIGLKEVPVLDQRGVQVGTEFIEETNEEVVGSGPEGYVHVAQFSNEFQLGPNSGQSERLSLKNVKANMLGQGIENSSGFQSLTDIDVTTSQGAQDSNKVVDAAIDQISTLRADLGAFQKNALESNLNSLRIAEENLTSAESTIRDADVAQQMSQLTGDQIMLSANTAMIAQANQVPRTVLGLIENSSF